MTIPAFDLDVFSRSFPAAPPLIVGSCLFFLGCITLWRERFSQAGASFFLLTLSVSSWLLCCSMSLASANPTDAFAWARYTKVAIAFLPCALLHFILVVTHRHQRYVAWLQTAFLLSAAFAGLALFSKEWIVRLKHFPWGYYPQYGIGGSVFLTYFFGLYMACLVLLWQAQRKSVSAVSRGQFRAFGIGLAVGGLGIVDFLACYGQAVYPVGFLAVFAGTIYIAQTVWRYRFADITPTFAANELVATLPHALLGVDTRGLICMANPAACELLGASEKALIGLSVTEFAPTQGWEKAWQSLAQTGALRDHEIPLELPGKTGTRHLSFSVSTMRDSLGQPIGYVCIIQDVTERKQSEEDLYNSESRFRRLFEANIIGFMRVDRQGHVLDINDALLSLLGYTRKDFVEGRLGGTSMTPREYQSVDQWMMGCLDKNGVCPPVDKEYIRSDGTRLPALVGAVRLSGTDNETLCFVVDSTERRAAQIALQKAYDQLEVKVQERTYELQNEVMRCTEAEAALRNMTVTDVVTGLYNRRGFLAMADQTLKVAHREQRRMRLYYADIDNLKPINDTHGHLEGDHAITQAGAILKSAFRASDVVARIGGDEFAILTIEDQESDSLAMLQRLSEKLRDYNRTSGLPYALSISIGSASSEPGQRLALVDLMNEADKDLYAQKQHRRQEGKASYG